MKKFILSRLIGLLINGLLVYIIVIDYFSLSALKLIMVLTIISEYIIFSYKMFKEDPNTLGDPKILYIIHLRDYEESYIVLITLDKDKANNVYKEIEYLIENNHLIKEDEYLNNNGHKTVDLLEVVLDESYNIDFNKEETEICI